VPGLAMATAGDEEGSGGSAVVTASLERRAGWKAADGRCIVLLTGSAHGQHGC